MTRLRLNHLIDNAIIHGLLGSHEKVSITIGLNLILGLITIFGNVRIQYFPNEQYLLRLNLNVSRLSLSTAQWLMDHDARIGQRPSLPRRTGPQQEGPHARGHTKAYRGHIARNVLHRIVNGHSGGHAPPRTVDVERNILGGVLVGQVQELGHEDVGDFIIHTLTEEDDPVLQ